MDERMALYREQWDLSNMTMNLFGIGFDMLLSELYKTVANKVVFVRFKGGNRRLGPAAESHFSYSRISPNVCIEVSQKDHGLVSFNSSQGIIVSSMNSGYWAFEFETCTCIKNR